MAMLNRLAAGCLILAGLHLTPAAGNAQTDAVAGLADGRVGAIAFRSLARDGATVTGTLTLPAGAAGPVAAMLIVHGSAGVRDVREGRYARRLGDAGYATFVLDSFGPRRVRSTTEDQTRVSTSTMIGDAFAALDLLATHPALDTARIGVIGFSKGGTVALNASFGPYRRRFSGDGDRRFAVHVAVYPWCNLQFRRIDSSGAPLLFLLGADDNYTPAQPCLDYADRLRSAGGDITVEVYPNAHHGFDGPDGRPPRRLSRAMNYGACFAGLADDTRLIHPDTGAVMQTAAETRAHFKRCVSRGATVGVNPAAKRQSMHDLLAYLARVMPSTPNAR